MERDTMRRTCTIAVLTALCGLGAAPTVATLAGESTPPGTSANYAPPFQTAARPALLALPPGAVEPRGWLRDWALSAKDGYTACMDHVHKEFQRAWTPECTPTGENLAWQKGSWSLEGGAYWFDGLVELGFALNDDRLLEQAKRRLHAVADNMNDSGILFLWWLDRNDPETWKTLYAANGGFPIGKSGLLGRTLYKYYTATEDPEILSALEKAYGSDPTVLIRARHRQTNLFPAYHTYTQTGRPDIAAALDVMFEEGCDASGALPTISKYYDRVPDRDTILNEHGVMFLQHLGSWTVGYLWTGNVNYLNAVLGWDDWLNRVAMQPYGVPVADEWYHATGAFRGTETCDVAMYMEEQGDLLYVTGDWKMADRIERAFFNAAPATLSRDCKTHVYFQCPNRFARGFPEFTDGPRGSGGIYKRTHSPLCCTAALNRLIPDYLAQMWKATYDNGLAAVCYAPCRVTARVADRIPVTIDCNTDYPFGEVIEMTFTPGESVTFPVSFHIPGWCEAPAIEVNGERSDAGKCSQGFLRIERQWKKGDTVRLHFLMTPLMQIGRDSSPELSKSRTHTAETVEIPKPDKEGKPYGTVSYGPLLLALPIPDTKDANTPDPAARWKFALDAQNPTAKVVRNAMPALWDWPLAAPLEVTINAIPIDWRPDLKSPTLPQGPFAMDEPSERITLIPYGCTKFRISMFPVTAEPENSLPHE
jgi:hypothetical protein